MDKLYRNVEITFMPLCNQAGSIIIYFLEIKIYMEASISAYYAAHRKNKIE